MIFDKLKKLASTGQIQESAPPRQLVALDIGTEYVKALVCKISDGRAEVIGVGRQHQELSAMQAGAVADISSVVQACDQALTEAEQQAGIDVREAVIGIAGELVKGNTSVVRYRRANSKLPLTMEEIESIVTQAQSKAEERARAQLALESGNADIDVRVVNSALVGIEIDGYPVTNPVGFQGGNVKVQLYTAYAPMIHIGALERVAQELDLELLALAAEPFAVARSVVGNDTTSSFSAILIDVGGGTTDIAVVNEGGVEGTQTFGVAGRAFSRTIATELGVSFEEAEATKLKFSEGQTVSDNEKVLASIDRTLEVWLGGVEVALAEFNQLEHLPSSVLLCGGGASLGQIAKALEEKDWYRSLPFTKPPKIQYVSPNQVVGVVDKTGHIKDHTYITAMGLIRIGLDSLSVDSQSASWREKINKLLTI